MIQHILVPIDGSKLAECVLPHAISFAKAFHARVTLIRVMDPVIEIAGKRSTIKPFDWRMYQTEADLYLKEVQEHFQSLQIAADYEILEGAFSERIIDYVHQNDVDFMLLSSHGQSGHSGWNISSNVQRILVNVFKPILIIRAVTSDRDPFQRKAYGKIIIPLDLSQRAECALSAVTWIARQFHATLMPIYLVNRPDMPSRVPLSEADRSLLDTITERNRQEAEAYLAQLKNRLQSKEYTIAPQILVCESIANALHDFVARNDIDLVAFCAHGFSGNTRLPFSSLVTNFIAFGTTPLLIIQDMTPDQIGKTMGALNKLQQKGH